MLGSSMRRISSVALNMEAVQWCW